METYLKIGLVQIASLLLNKATTLQKVYQQMRAASEQKVELITFGEALVSGYPFWLSFSVEHHLIAKCKRRSMRIIYPQAVYIEKGNLDQLCTLAAQLKMPVYLGIIECPLDRRAASLCCSLVYVNAIVEITSAHRKLRPTREERLVWSDGDGLVVHNIKSFSIGGLNYWGNWMSLSRIAFCV